MTAEFLKTIAPSLQVRSIKFLHCVRALVDVTNVSSKKVSSNCPWTQEISYKDSINFENSESTAIKYADRQQ